jgi:hypothetical protein
MLTLVHREDLGMESREREDTISRIWKGTSCSMPAHMHPPPGPGLNQILSLKIARSESFMLMCVLF